MEKNGQRKLYAYPDPGGHRHHFLEYRAFEIYNLFISDKGIQDRDRLFELFAPNFQDHAIIDLNRTQRNTS